MVLISGALPRRNLWYWFQYSRTCSTETLFCIIRKKRKNTSEQEEALNSLSVPNDVTVESIPASEKSTNVQLLNPNTRGWYSNISAVIWTQVSSLDIPSRNLSHPSRDFRQFVTSRSQEFFNSGFRLQIPNWLPCKHLENYASKSPGVRGSLLDMINHWLRGHIQICPSEIRIGLPFLVLLCFLRPTKIPYLCRKFSVSAAPFSWHK